MERLAEVCLMPDLGPGFGRLVAAGVLGGALSVAGMAQSPGYSAGG